MIYLVKTLMLFRLTENYSILSRLIEILSYYYIKHYLNVFLRDFIYQKYYLLLFLLFYYMIHFLLRAFQPNYVVALTPVVSIIGLWLTY